MQPDSAINRFKYILQDAALNPQPDVYLVGLHEFMFAMAIKRLFQAK